LLFLISLAILFQLLSTDVQAQYVKGKILHGKEISCMVDLPISASSKKIRIKKGGSNSELIANDDIDQILLTSNDYTVLLKRTYIVPDRKHQFFKQ